MPVLKNPRHEKFAHFVASGMPAYQAYIEAGFAESKGNPYQLTKKKEIVNRIDELILQAVEKAKKITGINKAQIIESLIKTRDLAKSEKQYAAAIRADELLGKAIGMFIERSEVGKPGEFEGISNRGELIEAILGRLNVRSGSDKASGMAREPGFSREQLS